MLSELLAFEIGRKLRSRVKRKLHFQAIDLPLKVQSKKI